MTTYRAATRLKLADNEYVEHGEEIDADELGLDEDDIERLLASKSILSDTEYVRNFPEPNEGANQAPGTPSNLEQIEGTEQQVNLPENDPTDEAPPVRDKPTNPADPPHVEGATDPGEGAASPLEMDDEDTPTE